MREWVSIKTSERNGASEQSEQCGANKWVSGVSELGNGQASGPVLTSGFLIILDHSDEGRIDALFTQRGSVIILAGHIGNERGSDPFYFPWHTQTIQTTGRQKGNLRDGTKIVLHYGSERPRIGGTQCWFSLSAFHYRLMVVGAICCAHSFAHSCTHSLSSTKESEW